MNNKKTKVYIYTRVSTFMQIDGYSLEAQKNKIQNYISSTFHKRCVECY